MTIEKTPTTTKATLEAIERIIDMLNNDIDDLSTSPKKIFEFLNSRVVGQHEAKKVLASAGFLHLSKMLHWKQSYEQSDRVKSSNVMISGPSGCGKTYLIQNLAEYLGVPYVEITAGALTVEGYKGMSILDHLEELYHSRSPLDRGNILHTIVFIDEFDKLCAGYTDNGWYMSIQHSLLKVIEGGFAKFPEKQGGIYTNGMLFILGGNFESIRNIIRKPKTIGFHDAPKVTKAIAHQEYIKAGVIQEIMGRISFITEVLPLTRKELKHALLKVDKSLFSQYKDMYELLYDRELKISKYNIEKILDECIDSGVGARGLHSALDRFVTNDLFDQEISLLDIFDDEN